MARSIIPNFRMSNFLILAAAIASASGFMESFKIFTMNNCTDNEFFCGNFECIPSSKQCDGTSDCLDGSDESDCEMHKCKSPEFFRCKNSRCLSSAFVCDSENDCGDFSDEENCEEFKKSLQRNITCPKDLWQCTDKLCIPKEWVCNGSPDCLDGSDEVLGCSTTMKCDGFKCKNDHCILKEWVCDGQDDCRDNSDEENCVEKIDPKDCTTEKDRFLCANGKTCIKLSQVCDATNHCPDKSDEGTSCNKTCGDCTHQCLHLPTGPKCVCPKGYHTSDDKHCEDINECEIYGICDQRCKNTPGSYQCYCEENYSLQTDKKRCKAHFGEATMYFSSKKDIRAYFLRSELYFSVSKNLKQVVGVDFDGRYVYWTDIFSEHESIVRSLKNGQKKELLVTSGLGAPEDLKVDYITKNIYFTDAERAHIGVCTNDGTHCTILVNKDVHKPRGIVLNPLEGEMYWTDWGRRPEIARSLMDGANATSFVSSDISWPNGLAIDHPNSRLYWTDAKLLTIESIRLDGTDRRVVLDHVAKHPYAIGVFENRLYWSDWSTRSIESCDKFTGKNHRTLIKEKEYVYGISIYHPNNHKKPPTNPCARAMCSNICLLSGRSYACACPSGAALGLDAHTCRQARRRQRLVVGAENVLIEVEHRALGRHAVEVVPVGVKSIGALAYNERDNAIYVSDLDKRRIVEVDLYTKLEKVVAVGEVKEVVSMDYDYLGNNLYWCDSKRSTVEVFSFNTQSRTILIHDLHGEVPESLALIPEEGVMFVAFQRPDHHDSHIDRFFMDGTARTHPLEEGCLGPVSLWYDNDLHRVFVADAGTGNIESTSAEGDDRHGFRALLTSPVGVTSLKDDIFWVNRNSKSIYWADKFNTGVGNINNKFTLDLPHDIEDLKIISTTPTRIGLSPCQSNNGRCSHLCLQSQKKIVCACPIGLSLSKDNTTCTKRADCFSNEFFCSHSNVCILRKFRCDGTRNCPNGEDEEDCKKPNHCPLNYFQCQDGECIENDLRCNLNYDCRDKSDERNCSQVETSKCPPKHFRCKNTDCINERLVCDGLRDCHDGEDEENCLDTVCKNEEFRCKSGACIFKDWECDHDFDCPDFSDEHPGCPKCPLSDFTCDNGKCIDSSFVCDNENDCGDHSDEAKCSKLLHCKDTEFSCSPRSLTCLPLVARCNGTSECPHNEDEQNCSSRCEQDEFSCNNTKCILKEWACDHMDDCGDKSDEDPAMCNHTILVQDEMNLPCHDKYQCKTGKCIDVALVCDGKHDCFDGSDEDGVCNTSCNALNDPCFQICLKTPTGPACRCHDGYLLQGDGQTCEDVDECDQHLPVCAQICHNIPGFYLCDCYEGFALRTDRTSCKAEGKAMSLIFVVDNHIREMSQMDNSLDLIYSDDTAKISGLDASNSTIYFSIEDSGTIVKINTSDKSTEFMEQVGRPQKLSVDWLTNNIYYVNNERSLRSISVCNFDDKSCANLIDVDLHRQVSALCVDATNNYLFYTLVSWWMFNSPSFVLYRANLDGTGSHELIKSTSGFVTGLTFDLNKKHLYFVDQHQHDLTKINYDGTNKVLLVSNLTRPNGLTFFENQVFFQNGPFMEKCRLYKSSTCDRFRFKSDLFTIVQQSRLPYGNNNCKNHTCSFMCVATKISYKCLCEDGKLVLPEAKCDSKLRESDSDDRRKIVSVHHHEHYSSHPGPVIAGVMISLCLLVFGSLLCYVAKKRNSGTFNVISMRFHNPGYGMHSDETERAILQPGQHEYSNPVEFYEVESRANRKEEMLVNV